MISNMAKPQVSGRLLSMRIFVLPVAVVVLLAAGLVGVPMLLQAAILIGIAKILIDSYRNIRQGHYSLDYIAFSAMVVSLATGAYVPGAVIALMFTGGEALEAFASDRAEDSLRALVSRIPKTCLVRKGGSFVEVAIQQVQSGSVIILKKGELVPLDGTLVSENALFDVSNLTGESDPLEAVGGALIKSGSVNTGGTIELRVVGDFSTSTYRRIIGLVEEARRNPARFVRLSEQVNLPFTIATFGLAIGAYLWSGEVSRALAVLVIATPCPLIIAAPVAFLGGLSRAAKNAIIIRSPASLEVLSRINAVYFDKTGTLTLGEPTLSQIDLIAHRLGSEDEALSIAASLEMHSLHPLARTLVKEAQKRGIRFVAAQSVEEKIGEGIAGSVQGVQCSLSRAPLGTSEAGIVLSLTRDGSEVARIRFTDVMKPNTDALFRSMRRRGIEVGIITGDRQANAESLFGSYGVDIHAGASPENKFRIVKVAKSAGKSVMMVGDGLNDAPALALADVGVVFSGSENAASIEAAHVVILERGLDHVSQLLNIAGKSVRVARESVYGGIALSLVGMMLAAAGYIEPVAGALIQEGIDVVVILNALRALR